MALQNFSEGSPGLRLWASTKIMATFLLLVSALTISPTTNNPSCNLSGDFTEVLSTGGSKIQASPHHSVVIICEPDKACTLQTTVAGFISFPVALHWQNPHDDDDSITMLYTLEAFRAIKVTLH